MYDTLIDLDTFGDVTVASLGNEVDLANAETVRRYLDEASVGLTTFVVSLENCRYIDSSGLRPIIKLAARVGAGFFIVVPPNTHIRRIFDIAGLDLTLNVCATLDEALDRARKVRSAA